MIKDIIEDLLLVALLGVVLYLAWTKYISGWISAGAQKVEAVAVAYKADVDTITGAVRPDSGGLIPSFVSDLWRAATPEITPAQFRANIEEIKKNLAGKM